MSHTYDEILKNEGVLCTTNVGVSMMPLLRENKDIMTIRPVNVARPDGLMPLDVVLFKRPKVTGRGTYVVHRILKVLENDRYWIVGDNCVGGEVVEGQNVMGVLTDVRRGRRNIVLMDLPTNQKQVVKQENASESNATGITFTYKMYVKFWVKPYHMRFFVLRAKGFARRCLGKVKRIVKKLIKWDSRKSN